MILVIDTNSLLQALAAGNPLRPLLDAWFAGRLTWAMSNEILFEYQEVITLRSGAVRWQRLSAMLDIVEQARPATLLRISPNFHFFISSPPTRTITNLPTAPLRRRQTL